MWTKDASTEALIEVVEFYAPRTEDHIGQKMVKEAQAELAARDMVVCDTVGKGTNTHRTYWIEGKHYQVVRRTKASFWVKDELGNERRFSVATGGSTEQTNGFKTYMI